MYSPKPSQRVLEIGTRGTPVFDGHRNLISLDRNLAPELINDSEIAVRGLAESLPFVEGSFDTVIISRVMCSVYNPELALAEICRVLIPGGLLVGAEHCRNPDPVAARLQTSYSKLRVKAGLCTSGLDIQTLLDESELQRIELKPPKIIRPWIGFTFRKAS